MNLDWQAYKTLCDRGDVLSRFLLEETARLLAAAGAAVDDTGIQDVNFFLTRDPGPREVPDVDAVDEADRAEGLDIGDGVDR